MLRTYYELTKPGIIYGNLLTAAGGFLFAAQGKIDPALLFATLLGTALVIASACVYNNYIDRHIDAHMSRTQRRSIPSGVVSARSALIYATVLGFGGLATLVMYTNTITVIVGLIGFASYVLLYGYTKRRTIHGTLIGSISGATPIVAGYTAVTGRFDVTAAILFLIMVVWQMPHFYAIAIYRKTDYAAAGIPVLPVLRGNRAGKAQTLVYAVLFCLATPLLVLLSHAGYMYGIVLIGLSLYWVLIIGRGFQPSTNETAWARKVFNISLYIVLAFSVMLALDTWLP